MIIEKKPLWVHIIIYWRNGSMNKISINKKERIADICIILIIGIFFVVYYSTIHPILIMGPDDWSYISDTRLGLPTTLEYNPARIFQETVTGYLGDIGAFFIEPILGDYQMALHLIFRLFIAAVITYYFYSFKNFIVKHFEMGGELGWSTTIIFILAHFLLFKSQNSNNEILFFTIRGSNSLNYCMAYTMPMFLCSIVVFLHMQDKNVNFLFLYLCIFSNMVVSVLLSSYLAVEFVSQNYKNIKATGKKTNLRDLIQKQDRFVILGLLLELVNIFFESNGMRAAAISNQYSWEDIRSDVGVLVKSTNGPFITTIFIILIIAVAVNIIIKENNNSLFKEMLYKFAGCQLLTVNYCLLLFKRLGGHLLYRFGNEWLFFFWIVVMGFYSFLYVIKALKLEKLYEKLAFFLMFLMLTICTDSYGKTFNGNTRAFAQRIYAINDSMIEQFKNADAKKNDTVVVHLPSDSLMTEYEWSVDRVSRTLEKHGVITEYIDASIEVDDGQHSNMSTVK